MPDPNWFASPPIAAAMSQGVSPLVFCGFGFAPCCNSSRMPSWCLPYVSQCSGVILRYWPPAVIASGSAPASSKARIVSGSPLMAATCSGVSPTLLRSMTSAPAARRRLTSAASPSPAAKMSGSSARRASCASSIASRRASRAARFALRRTSNGNGPWRTRATAKSAIRNIRYCRKKGAKGFLFPFPPFARGGAEDEGEVARFEGGDFGPSEEVASGDDFARRDRSSRVAAST